MATSVIPDLSNLTDQALSSAPLSSASEWVEYANQNWNQLKEISLGEITSGTDCVAFISAVLRQYGFDIWAVYTDGLGSGDLPEHTLAYRLFELGFQRFNQADLLQPADICFSIDAYFEGVQAIECDYDVSQRDGWFPTHAYFFMEWKTPGQTNRLCLGCGQSRATTLKKYNSLRGQRSLSIFYAS